MEPKKGGREWEESREMAWGHITKDLMVFRTLLPWRFG
jgi:hypothetical protein